MYEKCTACDRAGFDTGCRAAGRRHSRTWTRSRRGNGTTRCVERANPGTAGSPACSDRRTAACGIAGRGQHRSSYSGHRGQIAAFRCRHARKTAGTHADNSLEGSAGTAPAPTTVPKAAPATAPAPKTASKAAPAPVAARPATPPLDLKSLETRLRDTKAVGVFTKLSLKNQVDDLLNQFRAYHKSQTPTLAALRQSYNLLMLKVLTLLQDSDPTLARDIVASREAIWGILADPKKFTDSNLMAGVLP